MRQEQSGLLSNQASSCNVSWPGIWYCDLRLQRKHKFTDLHNSNRYIWLKNLKDAHYQCFLLNLEHCISRLFDHSNGMMTQEQS